MRFLGMVVLAGLAAPAAAQEVGLPSGRTASLYAVVVEPEADVARFRFLAPWIAELPETDRPATVADMEWLCRTVALPELQDQGWPGGQVVITLSDREVAQGVSDPEAVQFFEGYSVSEGDCLWEPF